MKIKNFFHIILLILIIFFLAKVPIYENTLLQLSENTKIERDYPIFNDDVALFYLESTNLKYIIYVKGLKKIDNIWVGNAYSYKEAYQKNSGFKWLEDDSEEYNPEYNREQKEIEYNKSTGYFIFDDKKEVYGLSEDEIKEMLNISSLKLENKLIFLRNIMLIYLGINLILCIISLFKKYKNIKNLEKYMEVKEKRIWLLYGLDFLTLFIYCIFTIFTGSEKLIELEKFIFYYIVLKNFLLYYYLKLSKKKFRKLVVINYLVLIFISIFIRNIRINIIFYYLLYFFSLLYLPIKQKLKRIVLVEPLYLITQILYLAIVYLWLYKLM